MRSDRKPGYTLRINEKDVIEQVNDDWRDFAAENQAPDLPQRVHGTSLRSHITGERVWSVYSRLLERARTGGQTISFPFRCDSPSARRYMIMDIVLLDDAKLEFRSRLVKSVARSPVPMLEPTAEPGPGVIRVCAWCRRVWALNWVEVEDAISLLGLFNEPDLPPVTHGICEQCEDRFFGSSDSAEWRNPCELA